jgi:hypothetical protein
LIASGPTRPTPTAAPTPISPMNTSCMGLPPWAPDLLNSRKLFHQQVEAARSAPRASSAPAARHCRFGQTAFSVLSIAGQEEISAPRSIPAAARQRRLVIRQHSLQDMPIRGNRAQEDAPSPHGARRPFVANFSIKIVLCSVRSSTTLFPLFVCQPCNLIEGDFRRLRVRRG